MNSYINNRTTFNLMFDDARISPEPDALVSDLLISIPFRKCDPEASTLEELNQKTIDTWSPQLHTLWHVAHDPVEDFIALLGLEKSEFLERFCIPLYVYVDWLNGDSKIPSYVRVMMAEAVGLLDFFLADCA